MIQRQESVVGKAGLHTLGELGRTIKSPREEASWSLWMGTPEPPMWMSLYPGRCVQGGNLRWPQEGQDWGAFWQALALGTVLCPCPVSPRCQLCHAPAASLQQHKPSASGTSTEKPTRKIKIWPFLKVAWHCWHTSLQSPYCWKNFCTDCFVFFLNIYIYICVCAYMYRYAHTPWLSNISLSCTTNTGVATWDGNRFPF